MNEYAYQIQHLNAQKRETMHVLHFILTLIFPLWILVWVYCGVVNSQRNQEIDLHIAILYDKMYEHKGENE